MAHWADDEHEKKDFDRSKTVLVVGIYLPCHRGSQHTFSVEWGPKDDGFNDLPESIQTIAEILFDKLDKAPDTIFVIQNDAVVNVFKSGVDYKQQIASW